MIVPRQMSPTIHQRSPLSLFIIRLETAAPATRRGSGAKHCTHRPRQEPQNVRGGERNETREKRAALLSSDARSLARGRFSRKHYFEESSKFWRSGRNALRINDYLADHRPENTLLEFDQHDQRIEAGMPRYLIFHSFAIKHCLRAVHGVRGDDGISSRGGPTQLAAATYIKPVANPVGRWTKERHGKSNDHQPIHLRPADLHPDCA
jgi:hypothetical protein